MLNIRLATKTSKNCNDLQVSNVCSADRLLNWIEIADLLHLNFTKLKMILKTENPRKKFMMIKFDNVFGLIKLSVQWSLTSIQ